MMVCLSEQAVPWLNLWNQHFFGQNRPSLVRFSLHENMGLLLGRLYGPPSSDSDYLQNTTTIFKRRRNPKVNQRYKTVKATFQRK